MSFISAGDEAVRAAYKARAAAERNKPKYDKFGKQAIEDQTKQELLSMEIRGRAQQNAMAVKANETTRKINREAKEYAEDQVRSARMAGKLAGGAALLGGAYFMSKEKPDAPDEGIGMYKDYIEENNQSIRDIQKKMDELGTTAPTQTVSEQDASTSSTEQPQAKIIAPPISNPQPKTRSTPTASGSSPTMDSIFNMAKKSGAKFPGLVAAQYALESGYGKTPSGKNNFFGIKAAAGEAGTSKNTWEVYDGKEVNTSARFKDFETPQAGVDHLVDQWHKDYKGYKGVNKAADAAAAAEMLRSEGYATDPAYSQKLIRIMKENGYL